MYQATFVTPSENTTKVRDLPQRERPVNRIREAGPQAVSTVELLACLLQSPDALHQAEMLVSKFQDLHNMVTASEAELTAIEGIGPAQAARIKAALEVGRRLMVEEATLKYQVRSPGDVSKILMPMLSHESKENFVVVALDTRNRILHTETLYVGTLNTSIIRIAEVMAIGMRHNAAGIVVAHNHPSGDPYPSPEDIALTRRLDEAGDLMEMKLLDHIVVGQNRYISMREQHMGFDKL